MKAFLSVVLTYVSSLVAANFKQIIACLCEALKLLNAKKKESAEKKQEKLDNEFNKKVDDVIDKGSIEDLLDLSRKAK